MILQYEGGPDDLIFADSVGEGTILNTETLEASFENVPQDHDGSNAFTFNVAFTNDVSITPAAMRDHAFTVTNGDVTGASRVDGRNNRWLITVDPDGDDAVTITLPGNRACGTQGAICSDEDNPVQLSNSPSATVAAPPEGDPLTASFSNVPDDHDGSDFHVDLTFSEGPDVGYRDVQKAVKVSGGSINRTNRKDQGQQRGLEAQGPAGRDRFADDHAAGDDELQRPRRDLHGGRSEAEQQPVGDRRRADRQHRRGEREGGRRRLHRLHGDARRGRERDGHRGLRDGGRQR